MPKTTKDAKENTEKKDNTTSKTTATKVTKKQATKTKTEAKTNTNTTKKETPKVKKAENKTAVSKTSQKSNTTKSEKKAESTKTTKKATTSKNTKTQKTEIAKNTTTNKTKSTKTTKPATTKSANTTKKSKTTATKAKTASSKKTTTKKTATQKTDSVEKFNLVEYYDLPYRYNQTVVKVLAQTPDTLFVYWDISDEDRLSFIKTYGEHFFNDTHPILLVHNETMNYTFEVEINDFANNWYLHVNDANCKYSIHLGRRPNLYQDTVKEDYIYVTSSNKIDAPNDHVLFENFNPMVSYRNIKTGEITKKDFSHLSKFKNIKQIYGIYDLYKEIYKQELFDEIIDNKFSNSSSTFK